MKPVIIIAIAVGVAISASVIWFVPNSDLDVMKTACDIHKDQVFEMGKGLRKLGNYKKRCL